MSRYAAITIKANSNFNYGDYIIITVTLPDTTTFLIQEVCYASRTGSGKFALGSDLFQSIINLRDAIQADFGSHPLLITYYYDTVTIAATQFSMSFAVNHEPSNCTINIYTESESTFQIDNTVVSTATSNKNDYCKVAFHLKSGYEGTSPYTIQIQNIGVKQLELYFGNLRIDILRSYILQSIYSLIEDADGNNITVFLPGMQFPTQQNITAEWSNTNNSTGDVILTCLLQTLNKYDEGIILEAQVCNENGTVLIAWQTVSNDTDSETETNLGNIELQNIVINLRDNHGGVWNSFISLSNPVEVQPTFIIPKSNSLRFVLPTDVMHYENKVLSDFTFIGKFGKNCQKFLQSSNLWIQVITDNPSITAKIVDRLGNQTTITDIETIFSNAGLFWINVTPAISGLTGVYKIIINDYVSDWFEVVEQLNPNVIVKWKNENEQYGYQDGIYWMDDYQEMVINGEFLVPESGSEKDILTDTNNRIINLRSYPTIGDRLLIYRMTAAEQERFLLAVQHYKFMVNDVEYQFEEKPELKALTGTTDFNGNILLRRVNYEIY